MGNLISSVLKGVEHSHLLGSVAKPRMLCEATDKNRRLKAAVAVFLNREKKKYCMVHCRKAAESSSCDDEMTALELKTIGKMTL